MLFTYYKKTQWTDEAWTAASGTYAKIISHPFIVELARGTLSIERFKTYIAQDELYLGNYGRQMFEFADMLDNEKHKAIFTRFARNGLEGEKIMHDLMISRFGIDTKAEPSTVTSDYNEHTETAIRSGKKEIAFAALLPCIWIYNEVGKHILSIAKLEDNPYKEWITEYGDEEFTAAVVNILSLINDYASETDELTRKAMTQTFCEGVEHEFDFWDYAYSMGYPKISPFAFGVCNGG